MKHLGQPGGGNHALSPQTLLAEAAKALQMIALALGGQAPNALALGPLSLSLTLTQAINEFLVAKARAGRSIGYLHHLRITLAAFARGPRGRQPIDSVKPPEIEVWLAANHWSAKSQKGKLTDLRSFYAWCVRRQLLAHNPAEAVELPRVPDPEPSLHTPDQVTAVLEAARKHDLNICRALAVRYFAGLRSAEANRLAEEDILVDRGWLEVKAAKAKTRKRRLVQIRPALAAWLALGGRLPLHDANTRLARFVAACGVPWPHNVTRHSFCSYHLAAFGSAAGTALEAGHTENVLFSNYRELTTKDQAEAFWGIRPANCTSSE